MTLHIPLSVDTEAKLRERAAAMSQDVASYAARLLHEAIATPSVDELLAPFRSQVEASAMSDDELDGFYEGLRAKVWCDKQTKQAKTA